MARLSAGRIVIPVFWSQCSAYDGRHAALDQWDVHHRRCAGSRGRDLIWDSVARGHTRLHSAALGIRSIPVLGANKAVLPP